MHEESELGVCAHWAYKDRGKRGMPNDLHSMKIDWLRSVLEWHDQIGVRMDHAIAAHGVYANQDRIFVTTPRGHVLDLSPNATPVDFAYRVHTEIGHRCRGARVDGRPVPLNRRLATGECVEIETGDAEAPRREWLNPALGFVNTSRARTKIQAWFKNQVAESNIAAGRALLEEKQPRALDCQRTSQPWPVARGTSPKKPCYWRSPSATSRYSILFGCCRSGLATRTGRLPNHRIRRGTQALSKVSSCMAATAMACCAT